MKKIIALLLSVALSYTVYGQPSKNKFETHRIAFITQRLNLTPEEAQQFWPIFNQFTDKMQQIRSSSKPEKSIDELGDSDTEKIILSEFDKEARELELKKEYYQKFKKVISVKKIAKLYRAERDFKALLLERIQQNKEERKQMRKERN